jgi:SAM-dependent methyltransferase
MPPSPWVRRHAALIRPGGQVLDLACGQGRHARWLAAQGYGVLGVDRDADALAGLGPAVAVLQADLEASPWPLADRCFDGIVITNYLWRPLMPAVLAALAPGGVLIHETYAQGQQLIGRPARPDFLLQTGELLRWAVGLRVVAYEDGFEPASGSGPGRYVQRIAAARPSHGDTEAPRYPLRAWAEADR